MNIKSIFHLLYHEASDYNLFIPGENDYDEEPRDPTTAVKYQKYTTRLYILLLLVCMYVLCYATLIKPQSRTIVVNDIDAEKFEKLYLEHGETLSCPCSNITISYQQFVSHTIRFHPVCTSFFVSKQWIEALYLPNATLYSIGDFRKIATSQFQLLSSLCSLSQKIILKNKVNLNNNQFITVSLLPQSKVESEVDATVQLSRNTLSTRILSFIDYFRLVTEANNFVTAVGTNAAILHTTFGSVEDLFSASTYYTPNIYDPNQKYYCTSTRIIGLSSIYSVASDGSWSFWPFDGDDMSRVVKGFSTGCFPFESILQSTLDCLYEIDCLQILTDNFPFLNQMNLNLTDYVLLSNKTNLTVYTHLTNLFVDKWTTTLNYTLYVQNCNPSKCTYTTIVKINYSYAIALFISLYGGLILILRSISIVLINILLKVKCPPTDGSCLQKCIQWIKQVNLFKAVNQRTENDIKQQKLNTRIYLILLIISLTVLIVFNSLNMQTVTKNISNPSLDTYIHLKELYSDTLECPCSTVTIPYHKFMSYSPVLHQICTSDLITDEWISMLKQSTTQYIDIDWRNRAYRQFRLLSKLCQLANQTMTTAINEFLFESLIVSNVLTEVHFNSQIEQIIKQFHQTIVVYFRQLVDAVNLQIQVDQLFMLSFTQTMSKVNFYSMQHIQRNITNDQQLVEASTYEIVLSLTSHTDIGSNSKKCYCSTDFDCHTSSTIFHIDFSTNDVQLNSRQVSYFLPGSVVGCSEIDSLLRSTLECFYSDSVCFRSLRNYLQQLYVFNSVPDELLPLSYIIPKWFNPKLLVYNSTSTSFYRNSSISTIIKNLFVEQWNPSYSYKDFYQLCAPNYCNYQQKIHSNDPIGIIVILISMLGGLIISLRFIIPHFVKLITKLVSIVTRKQNQEQEQRSIVVVRNWSERLRLLKQKLIVSSYNILISLNIFPRHTFGSNIDQETAKYYGKLATRLYFVLLVISFIILTLYTVIQQHMFVKEFHKPSFETYNQLIRRYGNQLKCSCSSVSSTYDQFIEIEPVFHEICSSKFTSDEMINNLRASLSSNLLIYDKRDYRRWILSHIQYLRELCQISIQSINSSIQQFVSTVYPSKDLLFKYDFDEQIDALIEQTKQNTPDNLNAIFFLIRNLNFGNAIVSTYGTNFKYVGEWSTGSTSVFQAETESYDDDCLCTLNMNCTSQAYFIELNSLEKIPIKGLKIGCTPSESLLSSTLECFYDNSCVNSIKKYTNSTYSLEPLLNQAQINLTINELVQNLFTDRWIPTKNYSSYYQQCLPSICFYTYIEKVNLIYLASVLLSLQGGLSIILKEICPRIIQLAIIIIRRKRKKRLNIVHSTDSHVVIPIPRTTNELELNLMFHSPKRFKVMLSCLLIMVLIVLLVIFSIYLVEHTNQSMTRMTISSTNPTINTNVTGISTLTSSNTKQCTFKFETIPIMIPESDAYQSSIVFGDFNNDNRFDIAYGFGKSIIDNNNDSISEVMVILANENGLFGEPIISFMRFIDLNEIFLCTAIDFNNDSLLDIVLYEDSVKSMRVLLGNGNGTFQEIIFFIENCTDWTIDISIGNLNDDGFLDLAVVCSSTESINIIFGNANGISAQNTILNNLSSQMNSIVAIEIGDFNGDNYGDILFINNADGSINVFLGYGNGLFDTQKSSLFNREITVEFIVMGDFNKDMGQDLIFSYVNPRTGQVTAGLMFGYNDGTFDIPIQVPLEMNLYHLTRPAVGDFNNDGYLDLVAFTFFPPILNVYFGDGDGNFESYTISSLPIFPAYLATVDFNGDGYQDIFCFQYFTGVQIFLNTGQCDNVSDIFGTSTLAYH